MEEILKARHVAISLLLCSLAVCALSAQSSSTKKEDDLLLVDGPNFVLPSRVGPFHRGDVRRLDKSGYDSVFSYNVDDLIKCDISTHPAGTRGYGSDLNNELQLQQNAISRVSGDVKMISRAPTELTQDDRAVSGLRASYYLKRSLFAERNVNCGLQLYVFRDGPWFVAYRFFYPRARSDIALKHIGTFISSWQWRQIPRHIP